MLSFLPPIIPFFFLILDWDWAPASLFCSLALALLLRASEPDTPRPLAMYSSLGTGALITGVVIPSALLPALLLGVGLAVAGESVFRLAPAKRAIANGALAVGALLLGVALVYGHLPEPVMPGGGAPSRIIVLGDSLSSGIPEDGGAIPWPQLLERELGVPVENFSFPGDTAGSAYTRWREDYAANSRQGELTVVLLGGNNFLQNSGREALDRELRQWAELIRQQRGHALFIQVPTSVFGDSYAGTWKEIADEYGFAFMDGRALRTIFTSPSMTLADRIHLNAEGQRYLAREVAERIKGG